MPRWTPLLLLIACSDYNFSKEGNPEHPGDTGATTGDGGTNRDECSRLETAPGDVAIDESCEAPAAVGSWTPVIEWTNTSVGDAYTTPVVGQLTDDNADGRIDGADTPDVVVANSSGGLWVLSGADGSRIWQASGLGAEPSTPAIADLDGDGRPEVVASGSGGMFAFRGDSGTQLWRASGGNPYVCGGVGVYDLDGDGKPEVIQGSSILDGQTGTLKAALRHGTGTGYTGGIYASFGVAADIDQDGDLEVVTGNALYDALGSVIWYNGQSDGFVAVGNFDSDPYGEIVVTWYPGRVRLQDHDGTVLWSGTFTGSTVGPPTIADYDADGRPEIGVAGMGIYVVIEHDGTLKWSRTITDYSSGFTGSAVFDFEGDGQAEVVFADENDLWVFDGATGSVKLQESRHSSATCSEYPAIADVDGDGQAEIIYTSSAYSGSERGVTVVGDRDGTWMPAAEIWNQHAYSITNVADAAGRIPTYPETNWLTYNNFRSGDLLAATGGALADAVPVDLDICTAECAEGRLYLSLALGNSGLSDLPAGINVSLYTRKDGSWELLETQTVAEAVASGRHGTGIEFMVDPAEVPRALRFVVDDAGGTGALAECNEDNNVLEIEAPCP